MYPTKKLWDLMKITKWKKVNYSIEKWKYNYIDIWILRTWIIEQYTNDLWVQCNKNDILIAWDGSKSWTVWFWLDWIIGSTLAKMELKEKNVDYEFLWKFLQSNFNYLNQNTSWAAIPHIRKDILNWLQIPLPPLPTQKLIVKKLDSAFENIDKNINLTKENLKNLEELNKSVLESFWDFKKVLVWDIVEELFAWWDLPKDWRYSKEKTDEYNIPIFANAIKEDWLYWYTEKPRVTKPAITISARWTIWFTKLRLEPFYPIVRLLVLIPKKELADLKYLEYILNTINLKQFWSSIPQLSVPQLKSFQIPLPSLQKQKEIVSYLDQIFTKNKELKTKYELQLKELEELKQSLLKDAFEWRLVKE